VYCWGANTYGQLGYGDVAARNQPAGSPISNLTSAVVALRAGDGFHFCAQKGTSFYCWGKGSSYQLGTESTSDSYSPSSAIGWASTGATRLSTGSRHSCAIVQGGVKCWGYAGDGQIGDNYTLSNAATPQSVSGLASGSGVLQVGAGYKHSCAIKDGAVLCWGINIYY
ncbi:MAG: hypothetical protein AAB425_12415, partial [Bdellovibrionota bacterium]